MAALLSAVLVVVLGIVIHTHPYNRLDVKVLKHRSFNGDVLSWANDLLDVAGSRFAIPLLILAVARLVWWRWRSWFRAAIPLVSAFAAWFLTEHLLKEVVSRPRNALSGPNSFPSGTMAVVAALGLTAIILLRAHHGRLRPADVVGALLPLPVIAWCFVLTGYHTASDMVGGVLLGFSVTLATALVADILDEALS